MQRVQSYGPEPEVNPCKKTDWDLQYLSQKSEQRSKDLPWCEWVDSISSRASPQILLAVGERARPDYLNWQQARSHVYQENLQRINKKYLALAKVVQRIAISIPRHAHGPDGIPNWI